MASAEPDILTLDARQVASANDPQTSGDDAEGSPLRIIFTLDTLDLVVNGAFFVFR